MCLKEGVVDHSIILKLLTSYSLCFLLSFLMGVFLDPIIHDVIIDWGGLVFGNSWIDF